MSERHLVLVGLMGAGKTTVGQRCAELLDRPFVDTDELVVAGRRRAVRRDLRPPRASRASATRERVAVADACASPEPLVIACGGGAVLDPDNRRALRAAGCRRVARRRRPTVLASRVGATTTRARSSPAATGPPRSSGSATLREPAYEAAADVAVDTDGRTRRRRRRRRASRSSQSWNG